MIKLLNITYSEECNVAPTMFPDKTSQIWKLPESVLKKGSLFQIVWKFQNEGEIMHLAQLVRLVKDYGTIIEISIPFLPYSRQDKAVSNSSTFALVCFEEILKTISKDIRVTSIDIHSSNPEIQSLSPLDFIQNTISKTEADLVCFPDHGAYERYSPFLFGDFVVIEKDRDELTGAITGMSIEKDGAAKVLNKRVLIVDDICDGGATFISAARILKKLNAHYIFLYTTHGIYSRGVKTLLDSDIDRIFNFEGEVHV